jgi:hypothetical protein
MAVAGGATGAYWVTWSAEKQRFHAMNTTTLRGQTDKPTQALLESIKGGAKALIAGDEMWVFWRLVHEAEQRLPLIDHEAES